MAGKCWLRRVVMLAPPSGVRKVGGAAMDMDLDLEVEVEVREEGRAWPG